MTDKRNALEQKLKSQGNLLPLNSFMNKFNFDINQKEAIKTYLEYQNQIHFERGETSGKMIIRDKFKKLFGL